MQNSSPAVEGYPTLACHMGACPDSSIFRRFGALNARNLLYMQAELVHLEEKLEALEEVDGGSKEGNAGVYSRDWYWLENSGEEGNGQQLETVLELREKLKEYSKGFLNISAGVGLKLTCL